MNEQVEHLESQLEELPLTQRIALYVTIIISFSVASWYLFGETMNIDIESKKDSIIAMEKKFTKNSISSLAKGIKISKKESLVLQEELVDIRFKDRFIQGKLEALGFIIFDEMGIAQILDDILGNSLKNYIDIENISSKTIDKKDNTHIVEKEFIVIVGSGSFKNIMALIQYIDSLSALLRIKNISVKLEDDKTIFELSISHYGVEL